MKHKYFPFFGVKDVVLDDLPYEVLTELGCEWQEFPKVRALMYEFRNTKVYFMFFGYDYKDKGDDYTS